MSREDVYSALSGAGIPIAHVCWPKGSAPELPWAVYSLEYDNKFNADDTRYWENPRWRVELYQRVCDQDVEDALESAIASAYYDYQKEGETYLESEDCFVTAYSFNETDRIQNG